ncbi:MAG: DUF1092 family protein [Oscillatoriales cyanobacterium SM2_1_8]|nr:DUF1092 family protein [Oscillatoriales cyanobacterium SM2_1_8]
MAAIWELDFYSRPVLQADNKKLWELLVCDRDRSLAHVQVCPSDQVNSTWLAAQLQAISEAQGVSPLMVRYFRPSMNNIVSRGCTLANLKPQPSRRLFALRGWLEERMEKVYPTLEGFQGAEPPLPLKPAAPLVPTVPPDALTAEQWSMVTVAAAELAEAGDWDMDFGEVLPVPLPPTTAIPGMVLLSRRARPLAAWMSGVDPVFLSSDRRQLCLDAGSETRWRLATYPATDAVLGQQVEAFAAAKQQAQGWHFLAVQDRPDSNRFAGFWLLQDVS